MSFFIGNTPQEILESIGARFFYGVRRTDSGELFLEKADQTKNDSISINNPGDLADNFPGFQEGQEFFEGRSVDHTLVYDNLNYEQFRWDTRNLYYYINSEGEFVIVTNSTHSYNDTDSSSGLE
jgi:hypothetical protein